MKTFVILTALIALGANGSFEPDSKVWVDGTSTVRDFKCNATEIKSALDTKATTEIADLVDQAQVVIPVASLDCGNGKMNDHMRKALKAEQNPAIEFTLASYDVNAGTAVIDGSLSMAGSTKQIKIPATVQQEGALVRVKASTKIKMTDWGIKPPSLMMGTMKVRDEVTVGFDVTLKQ